jgi:hypothetical protein
MRGLPATALLALVPGASSMRRAIHGPRGRGPRSAKAGGSDGRLPQVRRMKARTAV